MNKTIVVPDDSGTIMEFADETGTMLGKLFYSPSNKIKFEGNLESSCMALKELLEK
jgi:hypothetical protein